jgi:hypothetical protein
MRQCLHCQSILPPRSERGRGRYRLFCDYRCRKRKIQVLEPCRELSCPHCNLVFMQKQHGQKFCSVSCQKKVEWSNRNHRRRLITDGGELFSALEIFRRDRWKCQLCGIRVLKSKRGTPDPRAPELDHIIPLSRGGEHSRLNTQCACRKCNMAKGDQPLGQLRLFG